MSSNYKEMQVFLEEQGYEPDHYWWDDLKSKIDLFSKSDKANEPPPPRKERSKGTGRLIKELAEIEKKANELFELLDGGLDGQSRGLSAHTLAELVFPGTEDEVENNIYRIERINCDLQWISQKTQEAVKTIPKDVGGRNENFWEKQFVENMAYIWEELTGLIPSSYYSEYYEGAISNFLRFLSISYKLVGFDYQSMAALSKTVQRIFNNKRAH
jgi:hypothetical protein